MANLKDVKPYKILGPGDQIKEYLEIFNWSQNDLAAILGYSKKHVSNIVQNKQSLNIDLAKLLSRVFGASPQFWMNLDADYRIKYSVSSNKEKEVEIKAMLHKYMPVSEMRKRGWLPSANDAGELIEAAKKFWNVDNLNKNFFERKAQSYAMRKSAAFPSFDQYNAIAWLQMAKNGAKTLPSNKYNENELRHLSKNISRIAYEKNGVDRFIDELESIGVKFIYLKHIKKTYLDGAAFFDGDNPVIVYSGRYNRSDHFWFTVAHEIGHILLHLEKKDFGIIDDAVNIQNDDIKEREANDFASKALKHDKILEFFADKINYITDEDIYVCSKKFNIHPGIIVGALAYKKTINYARIHKFKEGVIDKIPKRCDVENRPEQSNRRQPRNGKRRRIASGV